VEEEPSSWIFSLSLLLHARFAILASLARVGQVLLGEVQFREVILVPLVSNLAYIHLPHRA